MSAHRKDRGQALVFLVLGMVVLLGFVGLAFDLGVMRLGRRQLQMVADAAAIAGAQELSYCTTNDCSALTTAAQNALTENGFTGSALITQCGSGAANLTVMVNNPPCLLGATDVHNGDKRYVEVVVSQVQPLFFAKILGLSSSTISTRAEAALGNSNKCLQVLDPADGATLSATGTASLNLPGCSIFVNSSDGSAVEAKGQGTIAAAGVRIVGGYTLDGKASITPMPTTHVAPVGDPLSYVPPPPVGSGCDPANINVKIKNITQTLQKGTYCGGIDISGNSTAVTFSPGTYVLDGGGLSISGQATVTGTGVTFFLTGDATYPYGSVSIAGGATVQLTAPTTGTYAAILFYQDPSAPGASGSTSSFTGGSDSYFQGALYFPTTGVSYSGGAQAQYTIIVAYTVSATGNAVLNSDYSSLPGGSPIKSTDAAVLAE